MDDYNNMPPRWAKYEDDDGGRYPELKSAQWSVADGDNKDPVLSQLPYCEYLHTQHWRTTRARALLRADGICKRCHATGRRLDVHHLTYKRLGREAEADLWVLCDRCHAAEHDVHPRYDANV